MPSNPSRGSRSPSSFTLSSRCRSGSSIQASVETSNLPVPDGYGAVQGTWKRVPALNMSVPFAAGALCSTSWDLARWSHLLATGRVMLPASYVTMTTPARLNDNTIAASGYALGVIAQTFQGHPPATPSSSRRPLRRPRSARPRSGVGYAGRGRSADRATEPSRMRRKKVSR